MTPSTVYLFVYGTLLSAATGSQGRAQRDRLGRAATSLGPATIHGRLYDLGHYPGLVLEPAASVVVHGELLVLSPPVERTLRWLDDYEGIVPGNHPHNEYERRLADVMLDAGEVVAAWVYVYVQPPRPGSLIASGSWLDRGSK